MPFFRQETNQSRIFAVKKKSPPHPSSAGPSGRDKQKLPTKSSPPARPSKPAPRPAIKAPAIKTPAVKGPAFKGMMLFGHHAIEAAWNNPDREFHALYLADGSQPEWLMKALEKPQTNRPDPFVVPRPLIDQMAKDAVHQGIIADVAPLPEMDIDDLLMALPKDSGATILMLDQVSDPQNIGSILRAAAAFGAAAVIAQERHAPAITASMAKIASGAVEHVPYIQVTNLSRCLERLAGAGFVAVGLDERGQNFLGDLPLADRNVLVLGAEGTGLRRLVAEHCDHIVRLPTRPPIASLNVAQAATIALYEATRQSGQ